MSMIVGRKTKNGLNRMNGFDYLNYAQMLVIIILMLFPLYYCFIVSISDGGAVTRGEVLFWPKGSDYTAYRAVLENSQIGGAYLNTIYYTGLGT